MHDCVKWVFTGCSRQWTLVAAVDNAVEETATSATGGVADALAESALLCHVEHAKVIHSCMASQSF